MSLETTQEFFRNNKSIPDKGSREYDAFFANELDKITYGVTINGVFIHGWLYFHWNHWNINQDIEDERNGDIIRYYGRPLMRDNEWIIAEHLKMAEEQKKGLMIFGSRRLGKSVSESSWIGRGAVIYEGSENVISSTNSDDLKIVTGLIDTGMSGLNPYFKHGRILNDWGKEVTFGIKDKKGESYVYSKIAIRNLNDGLKTEAFAGLTPKTLIIDEVGKANWGAAFESAKPSFTSPFGWRCVPWLTGTGGTLKAGSDAEKYFTSPESNNFLAIELPNKVKKYGLFISGLHRMEGKVKTTFGTFLKNRKGILIPETSELAQLDFYDTNEEKAREKIKEELDTALKNNDSKAYLKQRMYYPEDPDDCFLTDDGNDFPLDALRDHLIYLETLDDRGMAVDLYKTNSGKIEAKPAKPGRKQITDFPVNKETFKDAPIIIYEDPITNPPRGLYTSGADPYNQNVSTNSVSLGTVYIYKRLFDAAGEGYQDMMVASYAARPQTMKEWHENVEMLLDYYNATCMPENEGGTFIQYFDQKNKSDRLADGYNLARQINIKTSVQGRTKGLPATTPIKNFYMNLLIEYTKEEVQVGEDPETHEPIMKMGLVRIKDPMLVKEMLAYRKTDGNYDRIVAFGHTLACNVYFNKIYPVIRIQSEEKQKEQKMIKSPFVLRNINPFPTYRS